MFFQEFLYQGTNVPCPFSIVGQCSINKGQIMKTWTKFRDPNHLNTNFLGQCPTDPKLSGSFCHDFDILTVKWSKNAALAKHLNTHLDNILASSYVCHLLITFANSLDLDQDWHSVGPDLGPNCLTLWLLCSWKFEFWGGNAGGNKSMENYPACRELKTKNSIIISTGKL